MRPKQLFKTLKSHCSHDISSFWMCAGHLQLLLKAWVPSGFDLRNRESFWLASNHLVPQSSPCMGMGQVTYILTIWLEGRTIQLYQLCLRVPATGPRVLTRREHWLSKKQFWEFHRQTLNIQHIHIYTHRTIYIYIHTFLNSVVYLMSSSSLLLLQIIIYIYMIIFQDTIWLLVSIILTLGLLYVGIVVTIDTSIVFFVLVLLIISLVFLLLLGCYNTNT